MAEYIDREAAYNAIVNNYTVKDQLQDLCYITASDVAEVRHGRWIIEAKYTGYRTERCSTCGFVANRTYIQDRWFYCPNCGAKMDESEDEE